MNKLADTQLRRLAKSAGGYSLERAIKSALKSRTGCPTGLEGEISQEIEKNNAADGFRVPAWALAGRDLTAGTATDGDELVEETKRGDVIPLLRPSSLVNATGVEVVTGLQGDAKWPRITTGTGAAWAATETGTVSESDPQFDEITLTPHHVTGGMTYSRQLLTQSKAPLENLLRDDLTRSISTAVDVAVVEGSGSGGEPQGIVGATGVTTSTITTAGQPSKAELFEFLEDLDTGDALAGNLAWVTTPTVASYLKQNLLDSGVAGYMWDVSTNRVLGHMAYAHSGIAANSIVFGNWSEVVLGVFGDGSLDLVIDSYTQAKSRKVVLTGSLMVDVGIRHGASFCTNA